MVDEQHFALGVEPRVAVGGAQEHRCRVSSGAPTSHPATLFSSRDPSPLQAQWPTSLVSDAVLSGVPQMPLTYERASGGSRAVDAITLALSRQHLQLETQSPLPEIPASFPASSRDVPFSTADFDLQATRTSETRPLTAILRSPNVHSASTREEMRDLPKYRSVGTNNSMRQRSRIPPKPASVTDKNKATQTLVESMICSGTQCHVQASPFSVLAPEAARVACKMEGEAPLEVDEIMTDDLDLEEPVINKCMDARRVMKPSGITKNGELVYRSSTETALRCQNLVRNRPRMRKRAKIREKPSLSAMSSTAGSTIASASTPY